MAFKVHQKDMEADQRGRKPEDVLDDATLDLGDGKAALYGQGERHPAITLGLDCLQELGVHRNLFSETRISFETLGF